ncbi:carboxy-cis,cis-muconate cyclase [Malassezia sp. CBS 17886]|nr:carboxy-cis,cis-muconate cyclase [Malassezia sp. CBS 17886]
MPLLAVSVWGAADALPSIDPASLYAVALLQLARVDAVAVAPHTDHVPTLYEVKDTPAARAPGDDAAASTRAAPLLATASATTLHAIRDYLRENAAVDAGRPPAVASSAVALEALLDDVMSDLVLHALFSLPPNFQKVTAPALAGPHRRMLPASMPRRLRAAVRARLQSPGIALWGTGGSWEREERAEARRWNTSAGLAAARDPTDALPRAGLASDDALASDVREEWERSRLAVRARELFRAASAFLGTGDFLLGCTEPTSVDARLYSLLAPLLLPTVALPVAVLPNLLREEFPSLVSHTERLHERLWGEGAGRWAWSRGRVVDADAPSAGALVRNTAAALWAALPWPWSRAGSAETKSRAPSAPLPPTLRYGRIAWIATAVLGSVAWVFLTGIVTIEYMDEDDEDGWEEEGGGAGEAGVEDVDDAWVDGGPQLGGDEGAGRDGEDGEGGGANAYGVYANDEGVDDDDSAAAAVLSWDDDDDE